MGSGVMGSAIACHFANIGIDVLLLDIVTPGISKDEKSKTAMNKLVNEALKQAINSSPAPLYSRAFADRIHTGNLEDDLEMLKDYDWIIEAVIENVEIKQALFARVEALRKPGTLITTNTSGIPIGLLAKGRSDDFRQHFAGSHFFNLQPEFLHQMKYIAYTENTNAIGNKGRSVFAVYGGFTQE